MWNVKTFFRKTRWLLLVPVLIGAALGCAPTSSKDKSSGSAASVRAAGEVGVLIQGSRASPGHFRVLFGVGNQTDTVALCKIPVSDKCAPGANGYQSLSQTAPYGDRKFFVAEHLELNQMVGWAVYAMAGNQVLNGKPRNFWVKKISATP